MKITKLLILLAAAALMFAGCDVKDTIYDAIPPVVNPPESEQATITLDTDWSKRGEGINIPGSYTVMLDQYSATVNNVTHTFDNNFATATYRAHIYNTADQIAMSNTVASVASVPAPDGNTEPFIHNYPGWFFSCAMDAAIEKDVSHQFTAVMTQQVRLLTFTFEPTGGTAGRIVSITGILTGVAGSLDIDTNTYGADSNLILDFVKSDDGKWRANVRLLGLTESEQILMGWIRFEDGQPEDMPLEDNLTDDLAGFNTGKEVPFVLESKLIEVPAEGGFFVEIGSWNKVSGDPAVAE